MCRRVRGWALIAGVCITSGVTSLPAQAPSSTEGGSGVIAGATLDSRNAHEIGES
jgi:hypothetical protein